MDDDLELAACEAVAVNNSDFNPGAVLPYGLTVPHIAEAMQSFLGFLSFINSQLYTRKTLRLERILMQANFSSLVGEFVKADIPNYCPTLVKNRYHNGHPDLIPAHTFPGDAAQHVNVGIEVKCSRYSAGWQGHNRENTWLMVFVYDSNSVEDEVPIRPFRFLMVVGAELTEADWTFSGRSSTSRRTITASVNPTGYAKMAANWIYKAPDVVLRPTRGRNRPQTTTIDPLAPSEELPDSEE